MILTINVLILGILLLLLFIPATKTNWIKDISLLASAVIFIFSLKLLNFNPFLAVPNEIGSYNIISWPSFTLSYSYMVDGISVVYLVLTTFLTVIVCLSSRNIIYRVKEKYILLFLIELLLITCFTATEMLIFYLFFETILIPVFLMIGIWGSQKNKILAANQFVLYTIFGSFFMLTGLILLYVLAGSSNIFVIKDLTIGNITERILFILFFLSFAVKIPMMPLHLWLPKAHVEAPTAGSVLLAGILLKLGSYGLLRFSLFLFPAASVYFMPLIVAIVLISIFYSSVIVLRQLDLKRIVAYSSVAHMNYLVIGIFVNNVIALTGSLLLQMAHGLSSSALFLCVGMLYDRYKTRNIYFYRGLSLIMPFFCFCFFIFNLANLGFPPTVNFCSEILIFVGSFDSIPTASLFTLTGIFFSAIYSFLLVTRICYGPYTPYINSYYDLTRRESLILFPFIILIFVLGLSSSYLTAYWTFTLETWFIQFPPIDGYKLPEVIRSLDLPWFWYELPSYMREPWFGR